MSEQTDQLLDAGIIVSLAGLVYFVLAALAITHVVLNKKNEGAAVSWLGIIILSPFFGALLYWLFGVNRIRIRAQAQKLNPSVGHGSSLAPSPYSLSDPLNERMRVGSKIHQAPYLVGNDVSFLINGDESYPRMLDAINRSTDSVVLSSYIFDYDDIGRQFVEALANAHDRGVTVRVLIDGFGVDYAVGMAKPDRMLKKRGVETARFLSTLFTTDTRFINLRNHRKILSVDGAVAFIGGMNIRDENLLDANGRRKTRDIHFEVRGPIIDQISQVFTQDWQFASNEVLSLPAWAGPLAVEPSTTCRVIIDGPDDNYQKLELSLLAAINSAIKSILIATPYFLPNDKILAALQLAVLRGVVVEVIVPKKSNLRFVGWAMAANENKLLSIGVMLFRSPKPFDHSKLFIVDGEWVLVGSSNWDARSLEFNFEINMECYCEIFAKNALDCFSKKRENAEAVTKESEPFFLANLRNNFFRLFSPYL
ncbi:MAG: phospholipase D-like domain-containing protein [Granulosicoccaceae bacterium]